jgi:ketosteroid isomerase-like protein
LLDPEIEDLLDRGDKVITLAIEHGRGRGSGASVEARRTAHLWMMRAGKAIRLDLYLDSGQGVAVTLPCWLPSPWRGAVPERGETAL